MKCELILLTVLLSTGASAQELVDPTRPALSKPIGASVSANQSSATQQSGIKLSAVFVNGERKYAVVNGKFVELGESIQGLRLISIEKNKIVLADAEGQRAFYVNTNINIKKETANVF